MERLYAHIGSRDATLQQRPKVLKAVGVNAPIYVLGRVVDYLMCVFTGEAVIGKQRVSVERSSRFDMLFHFRLEDILSARTNNHGADFTAALKNSHDGGFVFAACSCDPALALAQVHVSSLTADESFVGFDFAAVAA